MPRWPWVRRRRSSPARSCCGCDGRYPPKQRPRSGPGTVHRSAARIDQRSGGPAGARCRGVARARGRDPRHADRRGGRQRRPPRLQPGCGRAHAGAAPGLRLAPRRHRVGHRPPGLRAQARHRAPGGLRRSSARRAGCRATRPAAESEHDIVENSHASTSLSYAYGLAVGARRRRRATRTSSRSSATARSPAGSPTRRSTTSATAAGASIVVLNDNGRCYAPTVSRLTAAAESPGDTSAFFAALGLDYRGPIDGHDIAALEDAFRDAAECRRSGRRARAHAQGLRLRRRPRPTTRSACTTSARSTASTGLAARGQRRRRTPIAFTDALIALAERHPEIVAITAGMPGSTGLLPFAARFPDRCFDVGIAEQHAVTAAAGMAMRGPAPGRRHLLHVPLTRVGPARLRRRLARRARWCSASIAPGSPVTTAPATTASTTSRCSPRSRA